MERDRLGAIYLKAVHEHNGLLQSQAEALIGGIGPLGRFDLAVTVGRKNRSQTKLAYMAHIQAHRCLDSES